MTIDLGPFVMFGGGGHARAVADVLVRAGGLVVLVVAPKVDGFADVEQLSSDDDGIRRAADDGLRAVLGIGDHLARLRLAARLLDAGVELPRLTAASATVASDAVVGAGTVVLEHAHVGPRARVGRACVVNTSAVVEHDVELHDGSFVAPGAVLLGGVSTGERVMIGAGAVVLPMCSLGAASTVGAGAMVRDDVAAETLVVGVPAEPVIPAGRGS